MIVTKKALSRRTVLRGLGTAIALPLLDSMVPALTRRAHAASPVRRMSVVYIPNGVVMSAWTPATEGRDFALTPILRPLAPFREQLVVISGLQNGPPDYAVHGAASTRFLTTALPQPSTGTVVEAGVSADQIVAQAFARDTQLGSLELSLDTPFAGVCDVGSSCVYTDTIAWRSRATPLPMEHNPRAVFERLFGEADTTDPKARLARLMARRSLLDSVTESLADFRQGLGASDRARVDEYVDAIRDVERQIQKAEEQGVRELPSLDRPTGVPATFPEHARLMFDLQVLAFQTDLTRVITFMMGRELSGRTYPEIGVHDGHHPISHHQDDPAKLAKLTQVSTHHTAQLAYYLDRLRSTPDGDSTLLDHMLILYGGGMSDGNAHAPDNLPVLLLGGAGGQLGGGRHLRVPSNTPIANLHATILPMLGVGVDRFGNSTGRLSGL
jgi:hypothetical protein